MTKQSSLFKSRKFTFAMIALVAFFAVMISGKVSFSSRETMEFLLAVFGGSATLHTISDVILSSKGSVEKRD